MNNIVILAKSIGDEDNWQVDYSPADYMAAKRAAAHELVGCALSVLGLPAKQIVITTTDTGKPFLPTLTGVFFNISYSNNIVVCASGTTEIGVDIEYLRSIDLTDYREYLSTAEYYQLAALPATEQMLRFFELWTLKESYLKMTGEGLSGLHHGLSMQFSEGRWWLWQNGVRNKEVYLQLYYPTPNHVVAICCHKPPPEDIIWVD